MTVRVNEAGNILSRIDRQIRDEISVDVGEVAALRGGRQTHGAWAGRVCGVSADVLNLHGHESGISSGCENLWRGDECKFRRRATGEGHNWTACAQIQRSHSTASRSSVLCGC